MLSLQLMFLSLAVAPFIGLLVLLKILIPLKASMKNLEWYLKTLVEHISGGDAGAVCKKFEDLAEAKFLVSLEAGRNRSSQSSV